MTESHSLLSEPPRDSVLVRFALAGSEKAWRELVQRHTPTVYSIARTYGLNRIDAEDIVQNTFEKVYRNLKSLRDIQAVGAWIQQTARNETIRWLQTRHPENPIPEHLFVSPALPFEDAEIIVQIVRTFGGLERRIFEILLDHPDLYNDDKELAKRLDSSPGTVHTSRMRAQAKLRAELERRGIKPKTRVTKTA